MILHIQGWYTSMPRSDKTVVATMGGQAQVVTFALDWLLGQGEPIDEVIVLHLAAQDLRVQRALRQLAVEFPGDRYARTGAAIRLRRVAIEDRQGPLRDIQDESNAEATWQTVFELIGDLKGQGRTLHLCIAGGRRIMGLMAMSAAMLHFGHQDRLWHLFTPDALRARAFEGALMHVEPDAGVQLIQVPLAPLGAYFPALQSLAQPAFSTTSQAAISARVQAMRQSDREHCAAVVDRLTPRQRDVLRALAAGWPPQEVADQLKIGLATVHSHKTAILTECRNEWEVGDSPCLDYHFLREKFQSFFEQG
jgi:CRISPR-associated protein Csx14